MSWDWKKALGQDAGPGAMKGPAAKHSHGGKGHSAGAFAGDRTSSIAWRPSLAGGEGLPGSLVDLLAEDEHECPFCRGRGEVASASVCPVCSGKGKVRVEAPAVRCAYCGGQGQMPPRSGLTCWVCKGRGLVAVSATAHTCPDCQGRGRRPCESLYCPRCHGVGVVASSKKR
jgi:DnaJ-class molecular chaperone